MSHEELRRFLTSAAENERHVQNGIIIFPVQWMSLTTVNRSLVQRGDDNVDITCQTIIDVKNTSHVMARTGNR